MPVFQLLGTPSTVGQLRLRRRLRPLPDPGRFERCPSRQCHRVVARLVKASRESRCARLKPGSPTVRVGEISKGCAATEPEAYTDQENRPIHRGTPQIGSQLYSKKALSKRAQ